MREIFYICVIGIVGLCAGDLVNRIVFRVNDKRQLIGKSRCRMCREPIGFLDRIPVVSYLNLKGRCRSCSFKISTQYPLVEIVLAVLFMLFFARAYFGVWMPSFVGSSEWLLLFLRDATLSVFLLIVAIYDLRFFRILDRYAVAGIVLAVAFNLWLGAPVVSLVTGILVIGAFFGFQYWLSHGKWMGAGDMRIGMLAGALLGIEAGLISVFFAYLLASIVGMALVLLRHRSVRSYVPFGAFLAVGILFGMLFGESIWNWYSGYLI
ncbi:MAG: prepilin peptidase [Patescibacteria group bacterium]